MKKFIRVGLVVSVVAVLVLLVSGCDTRKDDLEKTGMFGEHELRYVADYVGSSGHIKGSIGLFFGSLSGSTSTVRYLEFSFERNPDEFIIGTLPINLFVVVIDETKAIPTIELVFSEYWLNDYKANFTSIGEDKVLVPNWMMGADMIAGGNLTGAIIRISQKDLESEIYLPKQ